MEAAEPFEFNPWRRFAVLAGLVAAIELIALIGAAIALFGLPLVHHAQTAAVAHALRPAPKARSAPAADRATLSRTETSVLVLNGNGRSGAASTAAATLQAHGYRIADTGNAPRSDYPTTVVMYRPGFRPEAQRLARDLHVHSVGPLDGMRPRDLMGAHAVVILGR